MTAQSDLDPQPEMASPPRPARRWLAVAITPLLRLLVLRLAVPAGEAPGTRCPGCGVAAGLADAGYGLLLPAGRCGRCRTRAGASPYLLELAAVAAAVIAVLAAPTVAVLLAALWWVGCAVVLLFVDVRVHRLPDVLTAPAAVGVLAVYTVEAAVTGRWQHLLDAALSATGAGVLFLLAALLLGSRGMGLGDAKLAVSIAALLGWWGWGAAFTGLFLGFAGAGVVGAVLLATKRVGRGEHIALGPFFIAGTVATLALLSWSAPL